MRRCLRRSRGRSPGRAAGSSGAAALRHSSRQRSAPPIAVVAGIGIGMRQESPLKEPAAHTANRTPDTRPCASSCTRGPCVTRRTCRRCGSHPRARHSARSSGRYCRTRDRDADRGSPTGPCSPPRSRRSRASRRARRGRGGLRHSASLRANTVYPKVSSAVPGNCSPRLPTSAAVAATGSKHTPSRRDSSDARPR